ncbi:MAG TPA: squalene synthase HpnC [Vicinamibacterales bacterium]|nr:squalene synthase HpnC [Vicinamibacterales bacterium]
MVSGVGEADLAAAYDTCARFARGHYENFPVASRLVPAPMRPHIAAVYAFARVADDFADEGERPGEERLALLDAWSARLREAAAVAAAPPPRSGPALPPETDAIFLALGSTIRACQLPFALLEDLLSAFRQDVTKQRYVSWADVLDYCRRSANPVGRVVLRIAGHRQEELDASSDALCTALQLTNFWQDLERDWAKGRLYLPLDACAAAGANTADLHARRLTPAWRAVLAAAAGRTGALFEEGRRVCGIGGRLGWELRFTWLGGRRILERLEEADFDVFRQRPTLRAADVPILAWRALTWRGAR